MLHYKREEIRESKVGCHVVYISIQSGVRSGEHKPSRLTQSRVTGIAAVITGVKKCPYSEWVKNLLPFISFSHICIYPNISFNIYVFISHTLTYLTGRLLANISSMVLDRSRR